MGERPMTGADLHRLALSVTDEQVDLMAHALGWPSLATMRKGRGVGRPKWAKPYRASYTASSPIQAWEALVEAGLAGRFQREALGVSLVYVVHRLGQRVTRLRLESERMACAFFVEEVSRG